MEENLELCLARIFGGRPADGREAAAPAKDFHGLARQAREHFEKAQRAAQQGNWSGYGDEIRATERILKDLEQAR